MLFVVLVAALIGGFLAGRSEQSREREKEAPIKVQPHVSRTASGLTVISLDNDAVALAGITSAPTFDRERRRRG